MKRQRAVFNHGFTFQHKMSLFLPQFIGLLFWVCMLPLGGAVDAPLFPDCRLTLHPKLERTIGLRQPYNKHPPVIPNLPHRPVLQVGDILGFLVNCTCCNRATEIAQIAEQKFDTKETEGGNSENLSSNRSTGRLFLRIISENRNTVIPSRWPGVDLSVRSRYEQAGDMSKNHPECRFNPNCAIIYLNIPEGGQETVITQFWIDANTLGMSQLNVDLVWMNASKRQKHQVADESPEDVPSLTVKTETSRFTLKRGHEPPLKRRFATVLIASALSAILAEEDNGTSSNSSSKQIITWTNRTIVTVLLKQQIFYKVFDWSVFFIASLIALSTGCITEPTCFAVQIKATTALVAGLVIQLILIPLLSLGLVFACSLPAHIGYGLFVTTVVQSGDASFVVISLASECDQQFSAILAHFASVLNLVFAPIWICVIGVHVFGEQILVDRFLGLMSLVIIIQLSGALLRFIKPAAADAVLTWVSRPLLLLAGILLITLGVYINQYVFQHINKQLVAALVTSLTLAYTLGWTIGLGARFGLAKTRVLAVHASVFQGCLSIPILRMGLASPEGELASSVALWMVFLMPIPLFYHAVIRLLHRSIVRALDARRSRLAKRQGPTAMLCADSLAAVAATAVLLPELKGMLGTGDDASCLTVRSADAWFTMHGRDDRQSLDSEEVVRKKASARSVVLFKDGMTDADRERFFESIAGTTRRQQLTTGVSSGRRKNGKYRRISSRHPEETVCGRGPPPPPLPSIPIKPRF